LLGVAVLLLADKPFASAHTNASAHSVTCSER